MDKREKKKLLHWYDELSYDDDNIESEHDPFSQQDGYFSGDYDYAPDEPTPSEEDNDEVIFSVTETDSETQDSSEEENADNNLQENQSWNGKMMVG
ncbi:hypothetical protein JTB14_034509 [Gonioctena quinquepunctata]|nr:hypothetical protein JTB14_034509 [Gonioctena quinquepunctata]